LVAFLFSGGALAASSPTQAAPKAATASAHGVAATAARPEVGSVHLSTTHSARGRHVFRFAQSYAGFPVWARGASVTTTDTGAVVAERTRYARHFGPHAKVLSQKSAATVASNGSVQFLAEHATTLWLPMQREARLVHAFYRGTVGGMPFAPLVAVDAVSGKVLLRLNMTRSDRLASVFEHNPAVSPNPTQVVLEALSPGATKLETPFFSVQNCIDKGELSSGQFSIRKCNFEQTAVADAQGDFPHAFSSHTDLEDPHAEVAMFHHLTKAHAFFQGLGLGPLTSAPVTAIVNVRMPAGYSEGNFKKMQDPKLPLEPLDNAFYTPSAPFGPSVGPKGASLWFGQGVTTDFSLDGDVVAHELGHGVVDATIDFVGYFQMDKYGTWPAAGSMNEGISDYFSSALAGDPQVGEYAAQSFVGDGATNIRDLDNAHQCPSAIAGEVHVDSTFFSGALWSVRAALPEADRGTFDRVVFDAMVGAPSGDIDYGEFGQLVMAELELSSLGSAVAKALEAELTTRGILPECVRVLEIGKSAVNGPSSKFGGAFVAPGFDFVPVPDAAPFVPGVMQFQRQLPVGTKRLRVSWAHRDSRNDFGGSPYDPAILLRFDTAPIEFSYGSDIQSNAQLVEVTRSGSYYSAELPIDDSMKDVTVMIVNRGDTDGLYSDFQLVATTPQPPPLPGSGGTGGGIPTLPSGGSSAAPELSPAGGCTVPSPKTDPPSWLLVGGLMSLFGLRRRRLAR
jgi:hypothetical protein